MLTRRRLAVASPAGCKAQLSNSFRLLLVRLWAAAAARRSAARRMTCLPLLGVLCCQFCAALRLSNHCPLCLLLLLLGAWPLPILLRPPILLWPPLAKWLLLLALLLWMLLHVLLLLGLPWPLLLRPLLLVLLALRRWPLVTPTALLLRLAPAIFAFEARSGDRLAVLEAKGNAAVLHLRLLLLRLLCRRGCCCCCCWGGLSQGVALKLAATATAWCCLVGRLVLLHLPLLAAALPAGRATLLTLCAAMPVCLLLQVGQGSGQRAVSGGGGEWQQVGSGGCSTAKCREAVASISNAAL